MIKLENIHFEYNKDKVILKEANAQFHEGKMYAIVGPSGVGKSTLLSLIAGLDKPQSGELYFDEEKSDFDEIIRKQNIAMIFQNFLLFPYMTAVQNIVVAMDIKNGVSPESEIRAKEILKELGISDKDMHRPVKKLSGGEQQRVAIARALATGSKYILADEPTGNLDEDNAEAIVDILKKLSRDSNCCVIVVTHSDYIRQQADISCTLSRGDLHFSEE